MGRRYQYLVTPVAGWVGGVEQTTGTYQPHLAPVTLEIQSDAHMPLIRPRAGDVTANATDDRDAAQPALIRRRCAWVHLRAGA